MEFNIHRSSAERVNHESFGKMRFSKGFVPFLFLILLSPNSAHLEEKFDPGKWLLEIEAAYSRINDYTVILHKQERVEGKLLEEETIFLKFEKPFKVYMKWIKFPYQGREVIYAEGWNDNRMRVHEGGTLGFLTMNLNPTGSLAMRGSRHPVTRTGIGHLVRTIGENVRQGINANELQVIEHGEERMFGRRSHKVEAIFPRDRTKGYYGYRVIVHVNVNTKFPLQIQIFDWDDLLVECYGYEDLKPNVGLTDLDFDPGNPEYKF
jgi:hypothetical protein